MKIYFVRSYTGSYLYTKELAGLDEILVTWGPKNEASIYGSQKEAQEAGEFAFNGTDNATEHFGIVEIDTSAPTTVIGHTLKETISNLVAQRKKTLTALRVLRDLFEVCDVD